MDLHTNLPFSIFTSEDSAGCVVQADGHEWIRVDSTGVRITYCVSSRLLVVGTFFEGCAGDTCVPRVEDAIQDGRPKIFTSWETIYAELVGVTPSSSEHASRRVACSERIDLGHRDAVEIPGMVCFNALAATANRSAASSGRRPACIAQMRPAAKLSPPPMRSTSRTTYH
jgi:hypothetical protein